MVKTGAKTYSYVSASSRLLNTASSRTHNKQASRQRLTTNHQLANYTEHGLTMNAVNDIRPH